MPPKKGKGKPSGPSLPSPNTCPWQTHTPHDLTSATESEGFTGYEATGNLKQDILAYTLLLGVPPHPGLLPLKEGATLGPPPEGSEYSAVFDLEGPTDSFTLKGWEIDNGTWKAVTLALKAVSGLTSIKFSGCGLSESQLSDVYDIAQSASNLTSLSIEFNPLPEPPTPDTSDTDANTSSDAVDVDEEAEETKDTPDDETGEETKGDVDTDTVEGKDGGVGADTDAGPVADTDTDTAADADKDVSEGKDVVDTESKEDAAPESSPDDGAAEGSGSGEGVEEEKDAAEPQPEPRPFPRFLSKELSSVTFVSLRGNGLTVEDAKEMAEHLIVNRQLTALGLGFNRLGDDGVAALMEAVRETRTLLHLSLAGNGITAVSAPVIASSVTTFSLDAAQAARREEFQLKLFGPPPPPPPEPVEEPPPTKGKKGKGKGGGKDAPPPVEAHPSLPLVQPTGPSSWQGVGNYLLQTLDLCDNLLGEAGLRALAGGIVPSGAANTRRSQAPSTKASARLKSSRGSARGSARGKGGSAAVDPRSPDEQLVDGPLAAPIMSGVQTLAVALNRVSLDTAEAIAEQLVKLTTPAEGADGTPITVTL